MPTARRLHRVAQVLHRRQFDLCLALDRVHDQHNISAVLRSCDATGVGEILWEPDQATFPALELNPDVAKGSQQWIELKLTDDLARELEEKRRGGSRIVATHMGKAAVDFREIDWTVPHVVVLGNEQRGCRDQIAMLADANIFLPMMGFVQSLNISVAAAVILYEIQRQRSQKGMYQRVARKEQVERLHELWSLAAQGYAIVDLLEPPADTCPEPDHEHWDGRNIDKRIR